MNMYRSADDFLPKLICNNQKTKSKVFQELAYSFNNCDSFSLSVAFIAKSGLAVLRNILDDLERRGIKGRIITSTYLGFNEPAMFKDILRYKNIKVRIYQKNGFHPKGYLFEQGKERKIIIGSSNITQDALLVNQEWNICFTSFLSEEIVDRVYQEYEEQWNNSIPLTEKWIESYSEDYIKPSPITFRQKSKTFTPNLMQQEALLNLNDLRKNGRKKAILISSTGTGKTLLSAFDVKQVNPDRMLFVVHRENIARKAMESYRKVMPDKKYGMFTGNTKDTDCDFLFATIQTIGKREYLETFDKKEFSYIVVDEVHHAGASMHMNLIDYFEPDFLLGMTATPERSDDFDIYKLFDYNIAYEIRLQQAMEYDLLCPFHYYGISDLTIDGEEVEDYEDIMLLASEQRATHMIDAAMKYGHSGDYLHGLIFVSRKEEARRLSHIFNERGFRTIALTGEDSEEFRQECIDRLEKDDSDDKLDYIFTVDIFNEGIDIPCVNQVILARPTESAIVFVQQLGRGLRKDEGKDYLNVIDIIGNYTKNYLIPVALSGSLAYNKDTLRKYLFSSSAEISGASTVDFDEITKKRIFESIDRADFSDINLIKESYKQLKMKLGRVPKLADFDKYESIDPLRIFEKKSLGCYHVFLKKYEKEYKTVFDDTQRKLLTYTSGRFGSGKRALEPLALKLVIKDGYLSFERLDQLLIERTGKAFDPKTKQTLLNELSGNFLTGSNKSADVSFIDDESLQASEQFVKCLLDQSFKEEMIEVLDFALSRYKQNYSNSFEETDLCLYKKYTYEDICRLLNWEKAEVALNIGGYKYDRFSNTFPVFINYEKQDVQASINYEDHFISDDTLLAISKSNRTLQSEDMVTIRNAEKNNTKIHLFVRKNKDDKQSKEFYYLGHMKVSGEMNPIMMKNDLGKNLNAVEITYKLDIPVRDDIYNYIIG